MYVRPEFEFMGLGDRSGSGAFTGQLQFQVRADPVTACFQVSFISLVASGAKAGYCATARLLLFLETCQPPKNSAYSGHIRHFLGHTDKLLFWQDMSYIQFSYSVLCVIMPSQEKRQLSRLKQARWVSALAQIGRVSRQVDQSPAGHFFRDEETDYD
jgi:hypothetical protein